MSEQRDPRLSDLADRVHIYLMRQEIVGGHSQIFLVAELDGDEYGRMLILSLYKEEIDKILDGGQVPEM